MVPEREIFGNIPLGPIIYIIALLVVALMVYAVYRRVKIWRLGKPDNRLVGRRSARWKAFINAAIIDGLFHRKFVAVAENIGHRPAVLKDLIPQEFYPGVSHFLIFMGCLFLLVATSMDIVSHYIYDFIVGNVYFFHLLLSNVGGLMALIGVIMVFFRRYGERPERLDNKTEDLMALLSISVIVITGFVVQGFRIAATELPFHPTWSYWAPIGRMLALAFSGIDHDSLLLIHRSMWWVHSLIVFGFLIYIAWNFNRLWHIILSPLNVFWKNLGPRGAMVPIDLEKATALGVAKVEDFSWKNLLDLDACTRCGRCADVCPAHLSGKVLNPKKVIQDLKGNLLDKAPALLAAKAKRNTQEQAPVQAETRPMIGGVIETEAIWNCTTCYACQEVCPVAIEPMYKIGEMRRNLVMEQALIPETAEGALRSIENRGHPWRGTALTRTSWFEGMDIPTMADNPEIDILYWVGCTEALEDRSVKVAQATAKLMKLAGVKFGVLGNEESCCGDPARRLGNEYLYQRQAVKNIEVLKKYNFKKIVTGCPHCFNTLKNEYPHFGGNYEVVHHTDFLLQLFKEGKLKILKGPQGKVTYHDPCYLGRYNNLYEQPRELLSYIPDVILVEMAQNRERSFCCGGGGGHMWLEEQAAGQRINAMRTDQARAAKADIVATACPYCLQMFQDGIKTIGSEETLKVMDISEILAASAVYQASEISNEAMCDRISVP